MSELTTLFQNTADAIRSKTGDTATIQASQFPAKIQGISVGISQDEADARYLRLSGGTMTGDLRVKSPASSQSAVNKNYVNGLFKSALPKSGGTMTGALILNGAPTADNQAATKKYVDDNAGGWKQLSQVSSHSFSSDDTFRVDLSALPVGASNIKLTGVVSASEYIDLRDAKGGYPISTIGGNFTITIPIAFYVNAGKTENITGIINGTTLYVGNLTGIGLETMYFYDSDKSATLSNFKLFYK